MLAKLIQMAIYILELIITKVLNVVYYNEETVEKVEANVPVSERRVEPEPTTIASAVISEVPEVIVENEPEKPNTERPIQSELTVKYVIRADIDEQLTQQNREIY